MNAIIKGLAAIFAVVIVGHSGAHVTLSPVKHSAVAVAEESADTQDNPLVRGHGNVTFPIPPAPAPAPAPAAQAADPAADAPADNPATQAPLENQPISQLPIAVHPAPPAAVPPPPPAPAPPPPPAPAPPPPPAIVIGSTQQALINQDRAGAGLGPLNWSPCLAGIAYQNSVRMANQGFISHTNGPTADLGCGLGHQAGENVGYWSGGINDGQLNVMFMNSPGHHANIMGPYHYVGTAWVVAPNGQAYIAVEFS